MQYGASFSHPHLKWLGIDPQEAIKEYKSLRFKWIRLGCYWREIEKEEEKFDFKEIEDLIKFCEKNKINVVLTVGIKAPRYPEYYFPTWLQINKGKLGKFSTSDDEILNKTLIFIEKCVKQFKKYKCLKIWQVENEPMDLSGETPWRIDYEFLKKEVDLIRKLDPKRKILITLWGNELIIRKLYKKAILLADIVGIDIYLRRPFSFLKFFIRYTGPLGGIEKIRKIGEEIKAQGKEFWIAELQAEHWEIGNLHIDDENPPSFSPPDFKRNLEYALSLNPSVIFWWGFEYWLWRKQKDDVRYWETAKDISNGKRKR